MTCALEHETTRNYIHLAMEATAPEYSLTQAAEYRAILAWIAMREQGVDGVPILRIEYSANRLLAKLLARAAKDHGLGWGEELAVAATERG